MFQNLKDAELVNKVCCGERGAFDELVLRHQNKIFNFLYRFFNNTADIEEVLQETFLKAYHALPSFKKQSTFSTWIHRIAINEALMKRRAKKTRKDDISLTEMLPKFENGKLREAIDWSKRADVLFLHKEKGQILERFIRQLPEKYREVFVLREIEGLSINEVKKTLNLEISNIKTRHHRAKLFLRTKIETYLRNGS